MAEGSGERVRALSSIFPWFYYDPGDYPGYGSLWPFCYAEPAFRDAYPGAGAYDVFVLPSIMRDGKIQPWVGIDKSLGEAAKDLAEGNGNPGIFAITRLP